jgi:hypothetical protein
MKQTKFRAEIKNIEPINTQYWGKFNVITAIEEIHETEKDERSNDEICPFDIEVKVDMGDKELKLSIDKEMLETNGDYFYYPFVINDCGYQFNVYINPNDNTVDDMELEEWIDLGNFYDAGLCDNTYTIEDITRL